MKKIFIAMLLILSATPIFNVKADTNSTESCGIDQSVVEEKYKNQDNELVEKYEDNVEVIYKSDNSIVIRDYANQFNAETPKFRSGGLLKKIAYFIITAAGHCGGVQYLTNNKVDVCRIALRALGTTKKPNAKYLLTGKYISGRIPGCEPIHSGPCNRGYWEYRVVKL